MKSPSIRINAPALILMVWAAMVLFFEQQFWYDPFIVFLRLIAVMTLVILIGRGQGQIVVSGRDEL